MAPISGHSSTNKLAVIWLENWYFNIILALKNLCNGQLCILTVYL